MVVTLPVEEEHNNEDNDSVMESLLTKCKARRVAAWKLCVFGAIIVIGSLVLISIIIGLSQRPCSCPRLWIGFEGKCFYFSDMEKNQTWSRADCHTHGANLAVIQSKEEVVFVLCYNGSPYYWIALSHQNLSQRWECDDVTQFDSSLFPIGGGEDFAFLNNQRVTSARSSGERHWICTRQP